MRNFDSMYMEMAEAVSKMSRAERAQVGALLVRDNNVLSFGFNGTPSGFDNNCEDKVIDSMPGFNGVFTQLVTKPEVLHAESNALMKIAKSTQSSEGATMYVTLAPCFECSKLMVQAGVKRVVYGKEYRDKSSITFLKQANIEIEKYERTVPICREVSSTDH